MSRRARAWSWPRASRPISTPWPTSCGRPAALSCPWPATWASPTRSRVSSSARPPKLGRVNGLINNAATNPHFGPLIDTPDAAIDKTIEVNIKGYFYAARAYVAHVRSRGGTRGSIVNVASVAGLRAAPMQGIYGMTKAAVISMTQTLALELGSSGIRVNAIAPGLVETRFAAALVQNPAMREHFVKRAPLGRHAQPPEIAGAAVYLSSGAASYVTGHTMVIDGGFTIG